MKDYIRKEIDKSFRIISNERLVDKVYRMVLKGDASLITAPGQFINIKVPGYYLRRPISVSDYDESSITIIYKVVGNGTDALSRMETGEEIECLTGLGNGFDTDDLGGHVLLAGGGVGTPPMYGLAKELLKSGRDITVVLGFNTESEIFYKEEFEKLNGEYRGTLREVKVATVDGSYGTKGFVTECFKQVEDITDYCACGPIPMLKAIFRYYGDNVKGQLSLEERMGCGFGACVGCSIDTKDGFLKVCKDGPVFKSDILRL